MTNDISIYNYSYVDRYVEISMKDDDENIISIGICYCAHKSAVKPVEFMITTKFLGKDEPYHVIDAKVEHYEAMNMDELGEHVDEMCNSMQVFWGHYEVGNLSGDWGYDGLPITSVVGYVFPACFIP